jgi:hypothetical protein
VDEALLEIAKLAEQASLTQYEVLRGEVIQSEQSLQQITNWSLATAAAVFAGTLVFEAAGSSVRVSVRDAVALFVFGFGLPGFLFASSLTWLGDAQRIASIGQYIRAAERATARRLTMLAERTDSPARFAPMRFENYLVTTPHPLLRWKSLPYFGTLSVFVGGEVGSFVIYSMLLWSHRFEGPGASWHRIALVVWGWAAWPVLAGFTLGFALHVRRHSYDYADLGRVNAEFGLGPEAPGLEWVTPPPRRRGGAR